MVKHQRQSRVCVVKGNQIRNRKTARRLSHVRQNARVLMEPSQHHEAKWDKRGGGSPCTAGVCTPCGPMKGAVPSRWGGHYPRPLHKVKETSWQAKPEGLGRQMALRAASSLVWGTGSGVMGWAWGPLCGTLSLGEDLKHVSLYRDTHTHTHTRVLDSPRSPGWISK